MPLRLVRNDITKMKVDAIVNAANSSLLGGGGVDGAIHRAAGPRLLAECEKLGGCGVGEAKLTKGYDLPCKYVIHTVGPVWDGGSSGEAELLAACYRNSLALAKRNQCESVAFSLISSGAYGYPREEALRIAENACRDFLQDNELLIYLVIFDKATYQISEQRYCDILSYIDDRYAECHYEETRLVCFQSVECAPTINDSIPAPCAGMPVSRGSVPTISHKEKSLSLENMLKQLDESFSQMLLRKIDERGMTDAQCYKKANIDRKLFSKIRSDVHYKPSKTTAIAFAVALELSLKETKDMLQKAGFALSHSNKFDIIIEYFIVSGNYDIFQINEALFAFDQCLLGA